MTQNRRIVLNIVATYVLSMKALVVGLFCGAADVDGTGGLMAVKMKEMR